MPGKITTENVERVFGSVEIGKPQRSLIDFITTSFTNCAKDVLTNVPDCAHRSAALRNLLEAKWTCVDAIAKGGDI